MRLSISEALSDDGSTFIQWDVTPEVIVVLFNNRDSGANTLQARDWDGKLLWQISIGAGAHWGLGIGDKFVFLGSPSRTVQEYDVTSGLPTRVYAGIESATRRLAIARNAIGVLLIISAAKDGSILIWEKGVESPRSHLSGAHTSIFSLEVRDNILMSTGGPAVALWDLSTGELLEKYNCEDAEERLLFSVIAGKELLASGGVGGHIRLFDRKTGKLITSLNTNSKCVNGLIIYRPDILLSTDTSGQAILWSLETYEPIKQVQVHGGSFLTRTLFENTLISTGKEGVGPENACGLDVSLKSCDLDTLLQEVDVQPVEHGFPCVAVWGTKILETTMVICLFKRGKAHLDFWNLSESN